WGKGPTVLGGVARTASVNGRWRNGTWAYVDPAHHGISRNRYEGNIDYAVRGKDVLDGIVVYLVDTNSRSDVEIRQHWRAVNAYIKLPLSRCDGRRFGKFEHDPVVVAGRHLKVVTKVAPAVAVVNGILGRKSIRLIDAAVSAESLVRLNEARFRGAA